MIVMMIVMMMMIIIMSPIPQLQNLAATVAEANALYINNNDQLSNNDNSNISNSDYDTFHPYDEDLLKQSNLTSLSDPDLIQINNKKTSY